MEESDGELLLACQRGEEAAWNTLISRYQRLIYAIPRRAGLNVDLSADVFQEVFKTLLENLDDIEQPERLQAWLVTTARRKTWRLISRESQSLNNLVDLETGEVELSELADNSPLPVDLLLQMEEQHTVQRAVQSLDDRCRKLLTLLFYQEEALSYSEIAVRVGLSEGSIGPTRARCLQKLLRMLEK